MKKQSLPALKKKLQLVFNAYIRQRDEGKPCISCGKVKELQAGHFYSVRMYDGLRFNEDNCFGECAGCNCFDDMHLLRYKDNLILRIGIDAYFKLCDRAKLYKEFGYKWGRSELLEMIETYKQKIAEL